MTELAQTWRKVELVPEGYHMIVGERFPRRRRHRMRTRRERREARNGLWGRGARYMRLAAQQEA